MNKQRTIRQIKESAVSEEDFMQRLATMETGEISSDIMEKINGGAKVTIGSSIVIDTTCGIMCNCPPLGPLTKPKK